MGPILVGGGNGESDGGATPWPHAEEICHGWSPKRPPSLEAAENKVPIAGHKGPHPERYHKLVYKELYRATRNCRSIAACRAALGDALDGLAKEISKPGTELNNLVTRGAPR